MKKENLTGKHVLKYIRAGETKSFGSGSRKVFRQRSPAVLRNPWFPLIKTNVGKFLWFALITDTHAVATILTTIYPIKDSTILIQKNWEMKSLSLDY